MIEREGDLGRHRTARCQGGQCALQPDVEGRWMYAAGQIAQFQNGLFGPVMGVIHQPTDLIEVDVLGVFEFLLGHTEAHGQGHQLGLGPVVQIPLNSPQGRGRRIDGLRPSQLERADPRGQGVGGEQHPHDAAVQVDHRSHDPRRGEEQHMFLYTSLPPRR